MRLILPKFEDQRETIEYLIKHKPDLIELKKSVVKQWIPTTGLITGSQLVVKSESDSRDTPDFLYRTIVGNTYNWMDSHEDSHLNNLFAEAIDLRKGRIWHRHDHISQLTAKVGKFSKVYEQVVNWTDVGVNKIGQTMALLGDTEIRRSYNQLIFDSYKDNEIDQHSVGMQYQDIVLGVNNPDNKEEYAVWNAYINLLGNPEKAYQKGFCWFVRKADLIEISCVTDGSNELTGIYNPLKANTTIDPPKSSQKSIYDYLIN